MKSTKPERKIISDKLSLEKTGFPLEHWYSELDNKGAREMQHPEIYSLVTTIKGLKPLGEWNQNLLTTSYEWSRGLKKRGQREKDFEIAVSKTVNVPVEQLFLMWTDPARKRKWLPGHRFTVSKLTMNKSIRAAWEDGETRISVEFYSKGENKSQVVVQHQKILSPGSADEFRDMWTAMLNALKDQLDS
jgi:hypothetical protein